ncbi:MAG: SdpI family protein [Solimonas sp.]
MAILFLLTTLASVSLLAIGVMALLGRLPRNHFAGIRTHRTLASDEAWYHAHRVGSAPTIFGSVAALAIGLALLPFVIAGEIGDGLATTILIGQVVLLGGGATLSWLVADRAAQPGANNVPG